MLMYLSDAIANCEQALRAEVEIASACSTLGNLLQSMGRLSEALSWHTRAAQPQLDRREIFAGLGRLYAEQQQWSDAIAAYEAALALDADYDKAYWSLANIYAVLGETPAEVHHRRQAFQVNPRLATPRNCLNLGNSLWSTDATEAAIECYREALAHQPDFFEAHYNLAVALIRQADWQAAIAELQQSVALIPDYAPTYYCLGRVSYLQRQWQAAQSYFQQAIAIDPEYMLAWSALGEVCLKLHEWQKAQTAYEQSIALGGDFPWNYHNLGYAFLRQRQTPAALDWLQRALALSLDTPWFPLHLGEAWMQQERWTEAVSAFLQAAAIQQQSAQPLPELYPLLGRALKAQARQTEGSIAWDLQQYSVDFWTRVIQQLVAQRQYGGAVLLCQFALEHQNEIPDDGATLRSLCEQAQTAKQALSQTIAEYFANLERFPEQFWRYVQLAHLLADQGETEAAIGLQRTALGLKGWQSAVTRQYMFTRDWFTHNIPVWREHLGCLAGQPGLQALEIGCFEGMASCWLLDHILTATDAKLTCIDPFVQDEFRQNIDRAAATEKVTYYIGESHQILPDLSVQSYDLIYVSGSPLADVMQRDGEFSWQLLKPGGILIFDYYGWVDQEPIEQQSKRGIDAFLQTVQPQVEVLHRGYQVIVRQLGFSGS